MLIPTQRLFSIVLLQNMSCSCNFSQWFLNFSQLQFLMQFCDFILDFRKQWLQRLWLFLWRLTVMVSLHATFLWIEETGCLSLDSTGSPHPFNVTIPGKLTNVVIGVTVFYLILSFWSALELSILGLDDDPCCHGLGLPCFPTLVGARSCSFAFSNRAFINRCSKSPSLPATFDL